MAYIYSLADTWADGATTFKGIALNVTDSASASGSLLMDLQVTGAGRFSVTKDGEATFTVKNTGGTPTLSVVKSGSTSLGLTANSSFTLTGTNISLATAGPVYLGGIYANIGASSNDDVRLYRDAANTLALRLSTSPQAFNLYNTYTDASNYERGFMRWTAGQFRVGTEKAGTGAASNGFLVADGITCFQWGGFGGGFATMNVSLASAAAGTYDLGAGNIGGAFRRLHLTQFVETVEMTAPAAPATNGVRIYAEDNGSGKTRLMALFATGVAQQIAIEP